MSVFRSGQNNWKTVSQTFKENIEKRMRGDRKRKERKKKKDWLKERKKEKQKERKKGLISKVQKVTYSHFFLFISAWLEIYNIPNSNGNLIELVVVCTLETWIQNVCF